MNPAAKARRSGARFRAVAPISIEKLPAPAPADISRPRVTTSPACELTNGAAAVPAASNRPPATTTGTGPWRSASAPNTGCTAPQTNCPIASARLILAMPRPVAVFSGERYRPIDCRTPKVTIRIAAAAHISSQPEPADCGSAAGVALVEPNLLLSRVRTAQLHQVAIDPSMQAGHLGITQRRIDRVLGHAPTRPGRGPLGTSGRRQAHFPTARV